MTKWLKLASLKRTTNQFFGFQQINIMTDIESVTLIFSCLFNVVQYVTTKALPKSHGKKKTNFEGWKAESNKG